MTARPVLFVAFLLAALSLVGGIEHQTPKADAHRLKGQPNSIQILHRVFDARKATWGCQRRLGRPLTPKSKVPMFRRSTAFRWWALKNKWEPKAVRCSADLRAYLRARNALTPTAAQRAICDVWGAHCANAIAVARCETGGTFSVYAQNGQYLGLFQMGDWARSRYGHSYTPYGQAQAAYRNFLDNGWSQWECAYIVGII